MRAFLLVLLAGLVGGCAAPPEKVYWLNFHGEDEYYKWVCQYDPMKKVWALEGPTITYVERFDAQCFRRFKR